MLRAWVTRIKDETGAILAETIIVVVVVTVLTIGLLEFGTLLWQRSQVQIGVRDAARYWSRCQVQAGNFVPWCSPDIARNIAFYAAPTNTGVPRVPGWGVSPATQLTVSPVPLTFDAGPVEITGTFEYRGSPLYAALGIPPITITYTHQQRHIGW